MGNLHSSWLHRHDQHERSSSHQDSSSENNQERGDISRDSRIRFSRSNDAATGNISTQQESLLAPITLQNNSTTSITSTGSRRRRRSEIETGEDDHTGNHSRRRRLSRNSTAQYSSAESSRSLPEVSPSLTNDNEANSLLFYFPLPDSSTNNTTADESPSDELNDGPGRFQRAISYIRHVLGRTSRPAAGETNMPLVLVRIRQLPPTVPNADTTVDSNFIENSPSHPHTPTTTTSAVDTTAPAAPNSSLVQWTIYVLLPRDNDATATATIQRAFAVLRSVMSGDNMTYEELARLQEMLGIVSRGVPNKELIEKQIPARVFMEGMGIGLCCPICLAEYASEEFVRCLPCEHSYHAQCIDTWLISMNNCPLCRQPVVSSDTTE